MGSSNLKKNDSPTQRVRQTHAPTDYMAEDEINLLDYWRILVEYKKLILLVSLICLAVSAFIAFTSEDIFRGETTITPVSDDSTGGLSGIANQFGGIAALAGINLGGDNQQVEQALAVLQSRKFLASFIKTHKIHGQLFVDVWDSTKQQWINNDEKPTEETIYKTFSGLLMVEADPKTGLIKVAIEWGNPEQAADWVNLLLKKLNQHQKQEAIQEAQKSIDYLNHELADTNIVEMRQSMFQLIEAQTKKIMLANVRDEFAFKVIDPAVAPENRIKPKRKLMLILGLMVGVMLGVFIAFFLSFIRSQQTKETSQ